ERNLLRAAVGAEQKGPLFAAPSGDGNWAAHVSRLAPGLWMWSYASSSSAREAESSAAATKAVIWSVAALAAIFFIVLAFRRGRVAPAPGLASGEADGQAFPTPGGATARAMTQARVADGTPPRVGGPTLGHAATDFHTGQSGQTAAPDAGGQVTFGRYTLLDRLGEGGMAEVYTAVTFGAEGFRRTFVVKRLRAELARDAAVVAQFIDEANLGSTLVHSNIVPVF